MALATKEAESGNVREKVMQVPNASQNNNRSRGVYFASVNSPNAANANSKVSRKRVIQSQDNTTVKKRRSFVKKFRKEWMDEPIFRGWLQPIPNLSEKCWCSVCNVVLLCGHSELEKHASGKKHSDLVVLHQLKGDLMDSNPSAAVLDVTDLDECKKDESSMDSTDLTVVPTLELSGDGSVDSHLVFPDVAQDGTLVEMKMEGYDKVGNAHEVENTVTRKVTPLPQGTVINVGSTTITKNNTPAVTKTMPAILRQTSKQPQHVIKMASQSTNQTSKIEGDKRTGMLLAQYGTDTEDEDYDDDDDLSDSQQMIKEMKAEAAYQEKKLLEMKRQESELGKTEMNSINSKVKDYDEILKHIAEKELEVRLLHLQERRRQRFNIYKLKLQEMDARVRAAELELSRGEELHKLRMKHLQLQIMQQEQYGQQETMH